MRNFLGNFLGGLGRVGVPDESVSHYASGYLPDYTLRKIPTFYLISLYRNFMETHIFRKFWALSRNSAETLRLKLGELTVFCTVTCEYNQLRVTTKQIMKILVF